MSSLARRIQKKGAKIGIPTNTNANDYLARKAREEKRAAIKEEGVA